MFQGLDTPLTHASRARPSTDCGIPTFQDKTKKHIPKRKGHKPCPFLSSLSLSSLLSFVPYLPAIADSDSAANMATSARSVPRLLYTPRKSSPDPKRQTRHSQLLRSLRPSGHPNTTQRNERSPMRACSFSSKLCRAPLRPKTLPRRTILTPLPACDEPSTTSLLPQPLLRSSC